MEQGATSPARASAPLTVVTLAERPTLREQMSRLHGTAWPIFQSHGAAVQCYWGPLCVDFQGMQFALVDESGEAAAGGNTIPLYWDGAVDSLPSGWDEAVERTFAADAPEPNTLCALAAVVSPDHQGAGLSTRVIEAMKRLAVLHGFLRLIAPVRPSLKAHYPLTHIGRYATWKRAGGSAFDPWLRVHLRIVCRAEYLGSA